MFSTFGIILSEFWYILFGTARTLSVSVVVLLVHQAAFWYTRIVLGHFGYDWHSRYVWYTSCILVQ